MLSPKISCVLFALAVPSAVQGFAPSPTTSCATFRWRQTQENKPLAPHVHGITQIPITQLKLSKSSNELVGQPSQSQSSPALSDQTSSAILFIALPLLSLALPILLNLKLYAALSIAKRFYIYLVAASIVIIGSSRGATDSPNLGERLQSLTAEILPKLGDDGDLASFGQGSSPAEDDTRFEELRALDAVSPTAQSAALPAVVVSSLFLSILLLQLQNGGDMGLFADVSADDTELGAQLAAIAESLRSFLPSLVQLSNVVVIGLFVRAEVGRGIVAWSGNTMQDSSREDEETRSTGTLSQAILPASAALVGLAYFAPASIAWPIRNLVCSCLGIGVVRAVQIPKLTPIVAALMLLVVYDVYSVGMMLVELGSQSITSSGGEMTTAIAEIVTPAATSTSTAASSAMGAVAMSKVDDSSLWQPGLLEVRLRGRVTDLLGLGDAVFPSLLSTFALRFDSSRFDDTAIPYYFSASVAGYGVGCVACEFAPGIGSSGLPALLFIVPSMLISVFGLSLVRGELGEMFQYKPMVEEETQ